jgi:glucosamine--fructose-6-phosphate aminotransferase (isomerizing)
VRLAGIGSSRHAAGYGAEVLDHLGIAATVLPAPGRAVPLPRLHRDDVLVLVSQSGRTSALVELAETAPCPVVAVVNEPHSPLGRLATTELLCHAGAEQVVAATASVTAQMLLLRLLAGPADVAALAAAVGRVLTSVPDLGAQPPEHIVAGGLAAQWVADEIALKLAEMAALSVTADSVVDHLHGPVALSVPTASFVDPDDPNLPRGAEVTAVRVPLTGDLTLDPIVRVVAGQVLALHWAQRLGIDVDDPRGLSKVTVSA